MNEPNFPKLFSDALVSEIKAEMGRRDFSARRLAQLIGQSPQYVSTRIHGGNPRTGERVTLNVRDLYAIAHALGLSPVTLVERAQSASRHATAPVDESHRFRRNTESVENDMLAVASDSEDTRPDDRSDEYWD